MATVLPPLMGMFFIIVVLRALFGHIPSELARDRRLRKARLEADNDDGGMA